MTRSDNLRVEDILRASLRLREIGNAGRDAFDLDWRTQEAAVRLLGIIGEAANSVSDGFLAMVPQMPTDLVRGMRNRVVHEYWTIDTDIVWQTISRDIEPLIEGLRGLYEPPSHGSVFDEDHSFPVGSAAFADSQDASPKETSNRRAADRSSPQGEAP